MLCCVVRDRAVRGVTRADLDFFSDVLDVYFSDSMLSCLSIFTQNIVEQIYVNLEIAFCELSLAREWKWSL